MEVKRKHQCAMAQDTDVGAMEKREGKEESGPGQRAANGQTGERGKPKDQNWKKLRSHLGGCNEI
jgi:hypothetical protein